MSDSDKVKVMLVDDSAVIRGMITKALQESDEIEIVASVVNGAVALDELERQPAVDVILLDVEMPEMDGLTALPKLLEIDPKCKVIMVSSLTKEGAEFTIRALDLGATDCVTKPSNQRDKEEAGNFFEQLREKVITLGRRGKAISPAAVKKVVTPKPERSISVLPNVMSYNIRCLAIGSSTGGPQALMEIFRELKGTSINVPIFITQHMPATFTHILAKHINEAGDIPCEEAVDGQEPQPGCVYLAPGDYHLVPAREDNKVVMRLNQEPPVNFCRPAVDPMFKALAEIYGSNLLSVVLTGMGQDGFEGAKEIKERNGKIFIQDKESCVVWGMPKAISDAGIADAEVPLSEMADLIKGALR